MGTEETAPADDGIAGETGKSGTIPMDRWFWYCYGGVGLMAVVAFLLSLKNSVTITVAEGFAPFAVIYVVAQAIERLLQPFSDAIGKAPEKKQAKEELATARLLAVQPGATPAQKEEVVEKKGLLREIEAHRAILFWALATMIALFISGLLELGLIQMVAAVNDGDGELSKWYVGLDVVITGIAIGSGTKPLHDLISLIQAKKESAENPKPSGQTV